MSEFKVNKISPASGTAITLGDSGDTFTVPSGATIANSGTATGFGSTSASDLSSGTLPMARLSGTLPALNGSALTALNATELTSGTIPIARIADDAVTNAKMADDAIDSAQIADGSIDLAHMSVNSIDSDQYVDGSIDLAHLAADCVDGTKIADDAINSEHYAAASIDAEHLAVGKDGAFSLDATPNTDHTANGPQTSILHAGYSTTIMDLVYLNANGKWLEADADATGTSINLLGIALEAKADAEAMNVALPGSFVRDDSWNWSAGVPLYISGTLGAITATKPTGSGDVVRTVGYAVTDDVIFFNPSSDYVTLA